MSIRKVQLHLISKTHKLLKRYTSKICVKKAVVCDKSEECTKPNIDTGPIVKAGKDICVYEKCPKEPCPIKPCVPDVPEASHPDFPPGRDANIVIIGAGVAGLSCAQRLVKAGFKQIIILEAEDRPGGRINSGWLRDSVIEKGSNWNCKGNNPFKNHLVQLGIENKLFSVPLAGVDPSKGLLVQSDCSSIPLPVGYMAWNHLLEILQEIKCIRNRVPGSQSDLAESYIGIRMQQLLKKLPADMAMVGARVLLGLTSYLSPSLRKVISDSFGAYATAANMRIPLGYLGALAPLITEITPEKILYNKQVLNIRWGTVVPEQHPRAILKCRDGTIYNADYVIITCPLGVLKKYINSMFCPPLSPAKTEAIQSIKVGHIGKIFLEYDQPFWVWRDKKINKKWSFGELSKRSNFTRGMTKLEELPGSEFVILATIRGDPAVEMEKLTDREVLNHMVSFLKQYIGDPCIPNPKTIIKTNWGVNPHFLGAYTTIDTKEGDEATDPCLSDGIRVPLPSGCSYMPPVLYFAGEHTCHPRLMGTVRGAILSGIREAERVITVIDQIHSCELVATG